MNTSAFPSPTDEKPNLSVHLRFRSGEIHIFNSTGDLERIIPFTEADRKL
jgi:hypothetical protein